MLSKKLLLSLLITSAFVSPIINANQIPNTNIAISDQQLKDKLHHLIKTNHINHLSIFDEEQKNFKKYTKFSRVDENIGYHAYKIAHQLTTDLHSHYQSPYYLPPSISYAYLDLAKLYPEFFSQPGNTYFAYYDSRDLIYARVMDDPSQPILFIKLKANYDPKDHYVQWGETSSDAFQGFESHFYVVSK